MKKMYDIDVNEERKTSLKSNANADDDFKLDINAEDEKKFEEYIKILEDLETEEEKQRNQRLAGSFLHEDDTSKIIKGDLKMNNNK